MPRAEKRLILESLPILWTVRVALWLLPFKFVYGHVKRYIAGKECAGHVSGEEVERIGRSIVRAARLVPRGTCLTQGLTAQMLLARRGQSSILHFGAKKEAGKFLAHAWVEADGRIVVGAFPPNSFSGFREPGVPE